MGRKRPNNQKEKRSDYLDQNYRDADMERRRMIYNLLGLFVLLLMLVLGMNIGGCADMLTSWINK